MSKPRARSQDIARVNGPGGPVSTVDSFQNLALKLGMGADNTMSAGTYGFNPITRNRQVLEWVHRGGWLGGLAVDIPADDMTRKGIEYSTEMPPQDSDKLDRCMEALEFWPAVADVIRWGRLYGGAIGVIMLDGQDMREPLRINTVGPGQFRGVTALDRWMVEPSINDLVEEMGPHIGQPRYYKVMANAPCLRGQTIHHSRVAFRILGNKLPYQQALGENLWGASVLERLWDRLIAFDSASTGAAQLVYKSYLRTLKVKGLREVVAMGGKPLEGLVAYTDMMRRYQSNEGISLVDGEDEFDVQQLSAMSGVSDVLTDLGQQLSGALQIPLVRLFGQSPTGLNSSGESDLRTYYDGIALKQARELRTGTQLCYAVAARSIRVEMPPGSTLDFPSLWDLSDSEKATVANTTTQAVTAAKEAGLISEKAAMLELRQSGRRTGVFTNITAEDIAAADTSVGAPDPMEMMQGMMPPQGAPDAGPDGAPPPTPQGPRSRVKLQPGAALSGAPGGQNDLGDAQPRAAGAGGPPPQVRRAHQAVE